MKIEHQLTALLYNILLLFSLWQITYSEYITVLQVWWDTVTKEGPLCGLVSSALNHRSLPPEFESWRGHIWRVFPIWLRFITFRGRSAHLAYHVHKGSCKTSIICHKREYIIPVLFQLHWLRVCYISYQATSCLIILNLKQVKKYFFKVLKSHYLN